MITQYLIAISRGNFTEVGKTLSTPGHFRASGCLLVSVRTFSHEPARRESPYDTNILQPSASQLFKNHFLHACSRAELPLCSFVPAYSDCCMVVFVFFLKFYLCCNRQKEHLPLSLIIIIRKSHSVTTFWGKKSHFIVPLPFGV